MAIDIEGKRTRRFHERVEKEAREGNPLREDVSLPARQRLAREIPSLAWSNPQTKGAGPSPLMNLISNEFHRILGHSKNVADLSRDEFFTYLEVAVGELFYHRSNQSDVDKLQSILADDLCSFRFVDTADADPRGRYQLQHIDSAHLHREIVDRTFELTRVPELASAQKDYAEAWKHYSSGDLDDAVVNAHKAFESAAKVVIKFVDSVSTPDQMQTNQIVPELVRLDILPSKLSNLVGNLQQIFLGAGSLRNQAGTGHGALVPTSPEATVALMALRMSGTLVSFLAERRAQMRPLR